MAKILIKNGRVWDGEAFKFADVLTDGNTVAKIEPHISDDADFVYDATGKTVSPGLVDLHVHLKGIASDEFGVQAEMSSFPFGVTAVNDAGSVFGDRRLLDTFAVKNTVFVGMDIKDNHACFLNAENLLKKYGDKAIGIKVYFDKTISDVTDITPLKEACDYAKQHNLKIMVHCSHAPTAMIDIIYTLSAGDILTHSYHGGENACCDDNFAALKFAKEKGVVIDSGFAGHVHTDFQHFKNAVLAGCAPDTISTDITCLSAFKRGGRYGMAMCMSIAKQLGMPEADIWKAVTATPAKVLGKDAEWGFLTVGKSADIAVFDYTDEGFDLTDSAGSRIQSKYGYRCEFVLCDGQVVYRH